MLAAIINVITSPKDGFDYILKSLNWRHAFVPIFILCLLNIFSGLVMEEEVKVRLILSPMMEHIEQVQLPCQTWQH